MSLFKNTYKSLSRHKSPVKKAGNPIKAKGDIGHNVASEDDGRDAQNGSTEATIFDKTDRKRGKEASKDRAKRLLSYSKSYAFSVDSDPPEIEKTTANYIPDAADDESDDSLIDLNDISAGKAVVEGKAKEFEAMDKILEGRKRPLPEQNEETNDSKRVDFDIEVDPFQLQKTNQQLIEETKRKYSSFRLPAPIESRRQLLNRIEKHLHVIPGQLTGSTAMSGFYKLAQLERNTSGQASLKQKDRFLINWDKFYGGYFGFIRQQFVASVVLSKFNRQLLEAQKRNDTVAYWNVDNFTKYVLANEILLRVAAEDLGCSLEHAEAILADTVEYGKVVADSVSLANDLDIDELYRDERKNFMKGIDDSDSATTNASTNQAPGVLDRMFNLEDSDAE